MTYTAYKYSHATGSLPVAKSESFDAVFDAIEQIEDARFYALRDSARVAVDVGGAAVVAYSVSDPNLTFIISKG